MNRRAFIRNSSGAIAVGLTGCLGSDGEFGAVGEWADGSIEFGLPPFQDVEDLIAEYDGVFEWIASGFNDIEGVEGVPTTSYSAVVESVVNGHTELANLSPIIFVLAQGEGIQPLVINWSHGRDSYRTYLATRSDSGIESLDDLGDRTIAMVDPLSTSGGLVPRYMLAEAGYDAGDIETEPTDFEIEWAFSHDAALRVLEQGHVDAAAYGDFQHPDDESILKIAESEPIPFDPIVAKPNTPESVREPLIDRLLSTPESALEHHRIDRFGPIEPGTYDPIRDVAIKMGVDIERIDIDG